MIAQSKQSVLNRFHRKASKRKVWLDTVAGVIIATVLIVLGELYTTAIQSRVNEYRDVMTDVDYTQMVANDKQIIMKVSGRKQLECYRVPDSEQGEVFMEDRWVEATFNFLNDVSPGNSKPMTPSGEIASFGQWSWTGNMSTVTKVRANVIHICEPEFSVVVVGDEIQTLVSGKVRTTQTGPFPVVQLR